MRASQVSFLLVLLTKFGELPFCCRCLVFLQSGLCLVSYQVVNLVSVLPFIHQYCGIALVSLRYDDVVVFLEALDGCSFFFTNIRFR